jgi:hypothetical protein
MKIKVNTQPFNKVVKLTDGQHARVTSSEGRFKVKPSNLDGIRVSGGTQGVAVVHAGLPTDSGGGSGPDDGGSFLKRVVDIPINGHRVLVDTDTGVAYLSLANLGHGERILGLSTNAAGVGDEVTIQFSGEVSNNGWSFIPDEPVFPTNNGMLTQTPPAEGFVCLFGFASSATSIFINIQQSIYL